MTNVGGPPDVPIFTDANGGLTEDHFSLFLSVRCTNCGELRRPFSVTITTPDGITIIPTPIPAALPLFAMGVGLLWFVRRRRAISAA